MCEKAVEIQEKALWKEGDWIWADGIKCLTYEIFKTNDDRPIIYFAMTKDLEIIKDGVCYPEDVSIGRGEYKLHKYYKPIWLPRQDQLQDMIFESHELNYNKSMYPQIECFYNFSVSMYKYKYPPNSMEQLWLAFVMKEKFNKTWNGTDWIEQ